VFPVSVPPLRERIEDIPLLAEYLVERYAKKAGKKITTIDRLTLELLHNYDWPGNVRELQNVIERAIILCETSVPTWTRPGSGAKHPHELGNPFRSMPPSTPASGKRLSGHYWGPQAESPLQADFECPLAADGTLSH
jgi:transcriptional regulator with GAF, ATPase, and Fis domain